MSQEQEDSAADWSDVSNVNVKIRRFSNRRMKTSNQTKSKSAQKKKPGRRPRGVPCQAVAKHLKVIDVEAMSDLSCPRPHCCDEVGPTMSLLGSDGRIAVI